MTGNGVFGPHRPQVRKASAAVGGRTQLDRARRTLSQNFLVDRRAIDLIVKAANPSGIVLEPGAGAGALTLALAGEGVHVIGYEIDPRLARQLVARTRHTAGIEVVHGDFTVAPAPRRPFAVVGNIPYSVTSRIVEWCLHASHMTSATLLTQREYARKRAGDYGRWSRVTVRSWPWFHWRLGNTISRDCFRPVPSVDSAILRIERRTEPLVYSHRSYHELVELGFTGRGGSVRASLKVRHRGVDSALEAAGIPRDTVVGYVHPDQWVILWHRLCR